MLVRKVSLFSLEKFPISTIKRGDAASDDRSDTEQLCGTWYPDRQSREVRHFKILPELYLAQLEGLSSLV